MTGRLSIFVLLLFVILQTNLFARGCTIKYMSHGTFGTPVTCSLESSNNNLSFGCNGYSGGGYWAHCGSGVASNAQCHAVDRGQGRTDCEGSVLCCTDQCAADSATCVTNHELWDSGSCTCQPDTTYKCTSVSTENNVVRSLIDYLVHESSVKQMFVLGSCISNGFCEGGEMETFDPETNPTYAYDSCSYDSVSSQRCKFAGQNGSSCHYVCPDGRNWNCRMGWAAGGVDLPQCPSKPWKECSDEYVPPKVTTPPNPQLSKPVESFTNHDFDDVTTALDSIADYLAFQKIADDIDHYTNQQIYDNVAGYGAWAGDGIWQNTKRIEQDLNQIDADIAGTNAGINSVVINQNTIIKHIENDTIKVEVHNDSTKPLWTLTNWEPLVFAVDTNVQKVEDKLSEINSLVDTLVSDTPRTNKILAGVAPTIGQILDNLDTLIERIPTPSSILSGVADSIANKLKPWLDYVVVDSSEYDSLMTNFDNILPPNPTLDSLSDSVEGDTLFFDTSWVSSNDSLVNFLDSVLKEKMKDTIPDTLPLDQLAGDSAEIRNKLNMIFLPDDVIEECFEFHMSPVIRFSIGGKSYSYDLSMVIDFADLFGLDLCGLIRRIVEILTFIVIVFTTIKGYIRAFGGSNIGG